MKAILRFRWTFFLCFLVHLTLNSSAADTRVALVNADEKKKEEPNSTTGEPGGESPNAATIPASTNASPSIKGPNKTEGGASKSAGGRTAATVLSVLAGVAIGLGVFFVAYHDLWANWTLWMRGAGLMGLMILVESAILLGAIGTKGSIHSVDTGNGRQKGHNTTNAPYAPTNTVPADKSDEPEKK